MLKAAKQKNVNPCQKEMRELLSYIYTLLRWYFNWREILLFISANPHRRLTSNSLYNRVTITIINAFVYKEIKTVIFKSIVCFILCAFKSIPYVCQKYSRFAKEVAMLISVAYNSFSHLLSHIMPDCASTNQAVKDNVKRSEPSQMCLGQSSCVEMCIIISVLMVKFVLHGQVPQVGRVLILDHSNGP